MNGKTDSANEMITKMKQMDASVRTGYTFMEFWTDMVKQNPFPNATNDVILAMWFHMDCAKGFIIPPPREDNTLEMAIDLFTNGSKQGKVVGNGLGMKDAPLAPVSIKVAKRVRNEYRAEHHDTAQPYVCVSHVWQHGGALVCSGCKDCDKMERKVDEPVKVTSCDGGEWFAGAHLIEKIDFTRQIVRFPIWCDAVSVNQSDPKRKGVDVGKMGDIYKQAEQTIIVVDMPTDLSYIVLAYKRRNGPPELYDGLLGMLAILESGWPSRAWTAQECALSKQLVVAVHFKGQPVAIASLIPAFMAGILGLLWLNERVGDGGLKVLAEQYTHVLESIIDVRVLRLGWHWDHDPWRYMGDRDAYYGQDKVYAMATMIGAEIDPDYMAIRTCEEELMRLIKTQRHSRVFEGGWRLKSSFDYSLSVTSAVPDLKKTPDGKWFPTIKLHALTASDKGVTFRGWSAPPPDYTAINADVLVGTIQPDSADWTWQHVKQPNERHSFSPITPVHLAILSKSGLNFKGIDTAPPPVLTDSPDTIVINAGHRLMYGLNSRHRYKKGTYSSDRITVILDTDNNVVLGVGSGN
ncbi:hypothetical protein HK104_002938, partial [Borealophlyctis nickersoniae]